MSIGLTTIIFAIIGGALPTLIWLAFWLRQDRLKPEPRFLIFVTFLSGGFAVLVSLFLERVVAKTNVDTNFLLKHLAFLWDFFRDTATQYNISFKRLAMTAFFAPIIEETIKFFTTYFVALKSKSNDEPIDPIIYLITVALGFAAIENTFFLIEPVSQQNFLYSVMTGNSRFIGATLLHTLSSATLGMFIGFKYFKRSWSRKIWTFIGLITATILHSIFNYFIIIGEGKNTFIVFQAIWLAMIVILLLFEKIKRININKI